MRSCAVPEIVNRHPFVVVKFKTAKHGTILKCCRWNAEMYETPGEQIREMEEKMFADPAFVVISETVIKVKESNYV